MERIVNNQWLVMDDIYENKHKKIEYDDLLWVE
jgi:hypothetical protein